MGNFKLNVSFTSDQLEILYMTGSMLVMAKPLTNGTPNVAWQAIKPLQVNSISWEEEYGIYASNAIVTNGSPLIQFSSTSMPAAQGQLYTLQPEGMIDGPTPGGSAGRFTLQNRFQATQPYCTIGLFQTATVNGTVIGGNAISAAPVLTHSTVTMTPSSTVFIWLQSRVASNSVVLYVTSPMTELKFGGGINSISVAYDSQSGRFLPTAS